MTKKESIAHVIMISQRIHAGFPPGPAGMFQRRSQQGLRVAQLGEAVQEVGYLAKHGIRKPPCGFLSKK